MQSKELNDAILSYVRKGWSVIPLVGKKPPTGLMWTKYREDSATEKDVEQWFKKYGDQLTGGWLIDWVRRNGLRS